MIDNNNSNFLWTKFWWIDQSARKVFITLRLYLLFLRECGFRNDENNPEEIVQIIDNIIYPSSRNDLKYFTLTCIETHVPKILYNDEYGIVKSEDLYEAMLKYVSTYFGKSLLSTLGLQPVKLFKDPHDKCFIFYDKGVLEIGKDYVEEKPYTAMPYPIWHKQILKRSYTPAKYNIGESEFEKFIWNVCDKDPNRINSLKSALGYSIHTHKDPARTYAFILVDEFVSLFGQANGGSGKSLIFQSIKHFRNVTYIDGRTHKLNSSFAFQSVQPWTECIQFEDVPVDFQFDSLIGIITNGLPVEKKYHEMFMMLYKDSPKILINSNYIPTGSGGFSEDRRKLVIEVSPYYNEQNTPFKEFGHRLFDDWDENEWAKFDAFMIHCIQYYLEKGIVHPPKINVSERTIIQKTNPEFYNFMNGLYSKGMRKFEKAKLLDVFKDMYPDDHEYLKQNTFTKWIVTYLTENKVKFIQEPKDTQRFITVLGNKEND